MKTTIPGLRANRLNVMLRMHWRKRAAKAKAQRILGAAYARMVAQPLPIVVTLTRVAPSEGIDDDSLAASMKSVRDGIADFYKCGDGKDDPITWKYDQRKGPWAVELDVVSA